MAKAAARKKIVDGPVVDTTNPKDRLGALKVPLHLLPSVPMIYAAMVFELGAYKYGEYNWRDKAVRILVYTGAIQRHAMLLAAGEDLDDESGLPHAAHIIACACIIEDARAANSLVDDRFSNDGAVGLLKLFTEDNYHSKMLSQTRTPCKTLGELQPKEPADAYARRVVQGVKERKAARAKR